MGCSEAAPTHCFDVMQLVPALPCRVRMGGRGCMKASWWVKGAPCLTRGTGQAWQGAMAQGTTTATQELLETRGWSVSMRCSTAWDWLATLLGGFCYRRLPMRAASVMWVPRAFAAQALAAASNATDSLAVVLKLHEQAICI